MLMVILFHKFNLTVHIILKIEKSCYLLTNTSNQ